MGSMDFRTEQRQQQVLSPRMQHAVRLLQLSSLDFAQQVHDALGRNPFLEEGTDGDADPAPEGCSADSLTEPNEKIDAAGGDMAGEGASDRDLWLANGLGGGRRTDDDETSALDRMPVPTSLTAHLHGQLAVLPLSLRDLVLAKAIVESLDDDGYLRTDLEELIGITDLDPPVTLDELRLALCRVQALEPAGIAARSVSECLQLQLPAIECPEARELARRIVTEHLSTLAAKDVGAMAHALGRTPLEIEAACDRIRRLDPRPGWRFGAAQVQYVIPDVIVRKLRGVWTAQLNPAIIPKLRLNHVYAELFKRHRGDQNGELASQLQEARWTLHNVEQRFSTILRVAEAIVARQKHFLEYGAMAMKPLGLREIASELGLHESTVSRVTNNKYMATPLGVFELKYFFSRAMATRNGGECSGTAVRGLIKDMIEAETPTAPLSDAEIARQLAQQGLQMARRTITKYRHSLRIEPLDRRRRQT